MDEYLKKIIAIYTLFATICLILTISAVVVDSEHKAAMLKAKIAPITDEACINKEDVIFIHNELINTLSDIAYANDSCTCGRKDLINIHQQLVTVLITIDNTYYGYKLDKDK